MESVGTGLLESRRGFLFGTILVFVATFAWVILAGFLGIPTWTQYFALVGILQSLYLLYREIFTLDAFCMWCLGSLAVMTLLLPILVWRLLKDPALASAPAATSDGDGDE